MFLILSFSKNQPDAASGHRRVYMKDLKTFKVAEGTEIQVCQHGVGHTFDSLPTQF